MNGASVVASLPLTSPLITPSTGEAEPRGSSRILYDAYNTFCAMHIRNVLNATNEWASGVCRTVQVVQSIFLPFPLSVYPWREDPTSSVVCRKVQVVQSIFLPFPLSRFKPQGGLLGRVV